jgi:hypothetical protein
MLMRKTLLTLMALASLTMASQAEPSVMTGSKSDAAEFLTQSFQSMGQSARLITNSPFQMIQMGAYTYWVTKYIVNNWTMAGVNYGEITMGAVYTPDSNWTTFLRLPQFNAFLETGNRQYLNLPNVSLDLPPQVQPQPQINPVPQPQLQVQPYVPAPNKFVSLAAAEQDLGQAWDSLSQHQQNGIRQEERNWIKYKDSLPVAQRALEVQNRAGYLWSLVK